MKIEFRKSFEKDLRKIKDKPLLKKIKAILVIVEASNSLEDINNLKKIKADADYYRIRIGNYRIGLLLTCNRRIWRRLFVSGELLRSY